MGKTEGCISANTRISGQNTATLSCRAATDEGLESRPCERQRLTKTTPITLGLLVQNRLCGTGAQP